MNSIVIDGLNLCYRNHHRLAHLKTKEGVSIGVIFGFIQSYLALRRRYPKHKFYICWDTKSKRYEFYPEYKEHRKEKRKTEEYKEFKERVEDLKEILHSHDVTQLTAEGYEADDIAALLAEDHANEAEDGEEMILLTSDRDWLQLIDDKANIKVLRAGKKEMMYDEKQFEDEYGFSAQSYPLYKCLKGDKSDNIKGIMRFPTKLATAIANKLSTVEEFYINSRWCEGLDVPDKWMAEIVTGKEKLRLNWKLVILYSNISGLVIEDGKYDVEQLRSHYENFQLDSLLSKIKREAFIKRRCGKSSKDRTRKNERRIPKFKIKSVQSTVGLSK